MEGCSCQIIPCPAELRPHALRLLHDGLPEDQRHGLVQALDHHGSTPTADWRGLLIATPSRTSVVESIIGGVLWVQPTAGNTAVIWPPAAGSPVAVELFSAAAELGDGLGLPLVQLIASEHDGHPMEMLQRCGFAKLADLLYLFAEVIPGPERVASLDVNRAEAIEFEGLRFVAGAGEQPGRLMPLLERTYVGTQDCPGLDGIRPMGDVVDGYRAQGRYLPQRWFFVELASEEVGTLLLSEHPGSGNWELVYMGVTPEARGRGFGERMIRFALGAAARGGAERVVLAVDGSNGPALTVYRNAGFIEWDRRAVYARVRPSR